jgi:hypothetical protein
MNEAAWSTWPLDASMMTVAPWPVAGSNSRTVHTGRSSGGDGDPGAAGSSRTSSNRSRRMAASGAPPSQGWIDAAAPRAISMARSSDTPTDTGVRMAGSAVGDSDGASAGWSLGEGPKDGAQPAAAITSIKVRAIRTAPDYARCRLACQAQAGLGGTDCYQAAQPPLKLNEIKPG